MYIPAYFQQDDPAELRRLMRAHSFATLVTVGPDGAPFASHVPILVEEEGNTLFLRTHLARANPQWKHFSKTAETLVIFQGPHALVQSQWYESAPNVPTWNYAAVHAYGPVRLTEDPETTRGIAYRLVAQHTPDMPPIPEEYERRLLAAVVTFELRVTRLEGKYKLSQNKSEADRANVRQELAASTDPVERQTAALMDKNPVPR